MQAVDSALEGDAQNIATIGCRTVERAGVEKRWGVPDICNTEIEGSYHHITSLRRGPQSSYEGDGHHHNSNAMDVDCLMLSPVKCAHYMCKNCYFICHKEGCSIRNHPG